MGFFDRLKQGLAKTRKGLVEKVESILSRRKIDFETLDELEEALLSADLGVKATEDIINFLKEKTKKGEIKDISEIREFLKSEMSVLLGKSEPLNVNKKPFVILAVGVNGVGKTTTIGKLAARFAGEGKKVILAAADTFRAAAIEQLEIWAQRAGVQIVKHQSGSDPAAVAFDAIEAAKSREADVVIVDTAGRLHTKSNLMEELKKMKRVVEKGLGTPPHEVLLVVDATTGQNALRQAEMFNNAIGITGIALTKLDGTAKGGIIFAIKRELGIPIRYIGIGEGLEDLRDFEPRDFVDALFS